jgi:hypothetical protein
LEKGASVKGRGLTTVGMIGAMVGDKVAAIEEASKPNNVAMKTNKYCCITMLTFI